MNIEFCWENLLEKRLDIVNPLNAELNPICHLVALLGAHHILHVSWIRVKVDIGRYTVRIGGGWK